MRPAERLGIRLLAAIYRIQSFLLLAVLPHRGATIGRGVRLVGAPRIQINRGSEISIGDRAVLISSAALGTLASRGRTTLKTLSSRARIVISADVGMTATTICAVSSVTIGSGTLLGAETLIVDNDFHPVVSEARRYAERPQPKASDAIAIGKNVFIGARSIILKGSRIGNNCVVGAGSVVSGEFPDDCVVAGNPAAIIRRINFG